MLTALNIEEYPRQGLKGKLRLFRRNRLKVEHSFCETAAVKSVNYEHYRGQISWSSIDRFIKAQRNHVLCPKELSLPEEIGYKRFESYELSRRMCENAALYLLRSVDHAKVKTVLLDPDGDNVGVCEALAKYTDPVYVVTQATEIYVAQAENLLSQMGAAIRVSRSESCLRDADLIIAPQRLTKALSCSSSAVILSGEKPSAPQPAPIIYEYSFDLARQYRSIKPPYLDDMYFASALYTMAGAREMSTELFTRCGDGETIHTRQSLLKRLTDRIGESA